MLPQVTHHYLPLRLFIVAAVCLALFPPALKGFPVSYQCQSGLTPLSLGVPVDCEIQGSETHSFRVDMQAGDYARIKVQRKGIDLIVNVSAPGSSTPTKYESPAGLQSPMSFSIIATAPGTYTVALRPIEKWVAAGRYQITLEVSGAPSPQDQKRFDAERKVADGRSKQSLDTDDARRDALASYQQALGLWRELGDVVEEASTLQFMARTYRAFSTPDITNCVATYNQALERRGDEDKQARAYTLLDMADALDRLKSEDAFNKYEEARQLFETINNRSGQAAALYGKGISKARKNNMAEAVPYFQEALQIYTAPGSQDRHEEARTRHALGGAYDVLGQPQEAQDSFTAALQAWRETGDPGQEGNTYSSLGKLELDRGNWQVALETYDKAFELYQNAETISPREKPALRYRRASSLYNLAYVYAALSDYQQAFVLLNQSLALREPGTKGSTYMLTCYFQALNGEPDKALETCAKGITEDQASGSSRIAENYTAKGVALAMLQRHTEALALFDQALAIQVETRAGEAAAITRGWRGESLMALGQTEKALKSYELARDFWQEKDPNGTALALIGMAKAKRASNRLSEALKDVDEALALIEPLRTNVTSEGLRSGYFSTKIDYYDLYIDICMQIAAAGDKARLVAAFEASERERARSLIDTLAKVRFEGGLKSDPELAGLVSKYHNLQRAIQKARLKHEQSKDLQKEQAEVESRLRKQYPRYAALMFPQPLKAAEVQKLLDDDTLLLEFALGQERSYVWAVTATELHGYKLPPRSEIEKTALQLAKHLSSGQRLRGETTAQRSLRLEKEEAAYWPQATAFSRTLFSEIPALAHKKHLLIVADGQLQYLPFGALPAPDATANSADVPLVKDHQITTLPSASVLSVLRDTTGREQPTKLLAVFADPVFEADDSRIQLTRRQKVVKPGAEQADLAQALRDIDTSDNTGKLGRLYASGREARQILDLVPRNARLEAIGLNANRDEVTSSELAQYRIVHFATHSLFDEIKPERSGVVLSLYDGQGRYHRDGYLRLNDIYNLKLPVDLVVLSACRTGFGRLVRGEGVIGLTRGFMYAGTRGVLASFWNVNDDATAELMKRFYQKMLKEGMTPSAALSAAQWSMSRDSRWSNPYFWAGFVLQGDTR